MEYLFLSVNVFYQGIKWKCYSQQVTFLRKLEKYDLLSTIFYKKGQFKFNFLYFNKNLLYPTRGKEKWKNAQNRKMLWNILKKSFFLTIFQSTSNEAISFQVTVIGLEPRTT